MENIESIEPLKNLYKSPSIYKVPTNKSTWELKTQHLGVKIRIKYYNGKFHATSLRGGGCNIQKVMNVKHDGGVFDHYKDLINLIIKPF